MENYYCLVAGLPDLSPDDARTGFTIANFKADCLSQLSARDRRLVELFYLRYDNRNLLRLKTEPETEDFDERGCFTRSELLDVMNAVKRGENRDPKIPAYVWRFLEREAASADDVQENRLAEDVLAALYYEHALTCGNEFFVRWFTFNLHLNNILIALTARRFNFKPDAYLVGDNEVTEALRTSGARDFGLSTELGYYDELVRISEVTDPVEKEKKLDMLKWNWLEEETFFHYFSVEKVFAFLLKLDIIERWSSIDKEKGGAVFRQLINKLKEEVEVPAEFKLQKV